jgi:Flp pilus assembly protein TadD
LSRALATYADGDINGSLAFARESLRINDTVPEVNLTVGVCFLRLQMPDSATYYFNREIRLHPDRPKAYANLGSLDVVNGRYAEARVLLAKARGLQPYDLTAGVLWIRANARDSALPDSQVRQAAQEVIAAVPGDPSVAYEAAAALLQRGLLADAASLLARSLAFQRPPVETDDHAFERDFPDSPERFARRMARLNTLLGYVYGRQGNFDGAISSCRAAIALDSTNADAYINLASGFWSRGDLALADSIATLAATRFPDNQQVQSLRTRLYK